MRFKVALAYCILIAIPVAGVFSHRAVKICCDETQQYIAEAQNISSASDAGPNIKKAKDRWMEDEWILTSFITHEEVDAVTVSLVRAEALAGIDDEEELAEVLSECLSHIKIVRNFDKLSVRSIF